jgi:hypothetical protein
MSASLVVIANFDENGLKTIIETNQAGVFTRAGDKTEFKNAILDLYHQPEKCTAMGKNGRNFILKNLAHSVATDKYIESIKQSSKS